MISCNFVSICIYGMCLMNVNLPLDQKYLIKVGCVGGFDGNTLVVNGKTDTGSYF